jgi:CubicO group peptidase (beta-lactamase class C family)
VLGIPEWSAYAATKAGIRIDVEAKKPMRTDIIFRVAYQRKPITATALLMLFEEGKLYLTDPVSKFIPKFKGQKCCDREPRAGSVLRSIA